MPCPFCELEESALVWSSSDTVALRDRFPVSPGHTLVIPRRHVESYFDATESEQQSLWRGVAAVKAQLDAAHAPDGYNVGFDAGASAGQTVMHLHVHVIPRYRGDMEDPRGGVRGVIPAKQKYGSTDTASAVDASGEPIDPFDDILDFVHGEESHLVDALRRAIRRSDRADIVSAFVQPSGLRLIEPDLVDAIARGASRGSATSFSRELSGDLHGDSIGYARRATGRAHPGTARDRSRWLASG